MNHVGLNPLRTILIRLANQSMNTQSAARGGAEVDLQWLMSEVIEASLSFAPPLLLEIIDPGICHFPQQKGDGFGIHHILQNRKTMRCDIVNVTHLMA